MLLTSTGRWGKLPKIRKNQPGWGILGILNRHESALYECLQGMFNAKPDLVVCYGDKLLVYEAKFTLGFDERQLERTRKIGDVWKRLLYADLEFENPPETRVLKLGLEKYEPDVSWTDVLNIGRKYLQEGDLSLGAFESAVLS